MEEAGLLVFKFTIFAITVTQPIAVIAVIAFDSKTSILKAKDLLNEFEL